MIVCGIDTSTETVAVGVCEGERVIAERSIGRGEAARPRHGEALLGAVEDCVTAAGGWEVIDRIAVGVGPGTYTGLRIGIVSARAYGAARGCEIAAVSSLQALAVAGRAGSESVAAMIDARRSEVFVAVYGGGGELISPPRTVTDCRLDEVLEAVGPGRPPLRCCGGGAVRFRAELERIEGFVVPPDGDPAHQIRGRTVAALGALSAPVSRRQIVPVYLREPDAKRWIERDLLA